MVVLLGSWDVVRRAQYAGLSAGHSMTNGRWGRFSVDGTEWKEMDFGREGLTTRRPLLQEHRTGTGRPQCSGAQWEGRPFVLNKTEFFDFVLLFVLVKLLFLYIHIYIYINYLVNI
jgi:hypothetical protein